MCGVEQNSASRSLKIKSNCIMVSLVTTVLNDRRGAEIFIVQMAAQTRRPDEIVIVDGGSNDGTWEYLQSLDAEMTRTVNIVTHQEVGCNVARGRDLAIGRATGNLIVSTDVGCKWDSEWLEELVAPLEQDYAGEVDVVIGSWAVRLEDAKSDWALVEFARRYPFRMEATPGSLGINRAIAYRREVWEKVGGYPQDLTLAADDVVFDMIIRQSKWGFRFAAAPIIRCYWERHKRLVQFGKEERRNFYGAAEAGIWLKHFVFVAGRICVEAAALVSTVVLVCVPELAAVALVPMAVFLVSIVTRLRALAPAAARLREMGVKSRWLKLLAFEYLTKIRGMQGYWSGMWNGARHCAATRKRLKA
jgi:glycosyltransferase involved in cell wall biosynthesis